MFRRHKAKRDRLDQQPANGYTRDGARLVLRGHTAFYATTDKAARRFMAYQRGLCVSGR